MAQNVIFFGGCFPWAWKECVCWNFWMEYSINVNYIQLIDGSVEFIYVFSDFPASDLSISDKGVLKSLTMIGVHTFLFAILILAVHATHSSMFCWKVHAHYGLLCLLKELTPLFYGIPSLFLRTFLDLKSSLSEIKILTPAFFGLVLTWYIFFHSFIIILPYMCFLSKYILKGIKELHLVF